MSNLALNMTHRGASSARFCEILILDDSTFDRKRLARAIAQAPFACNFTEASSLRQFTQQLRQKSYDIVLVDFSLQDGDGLQALDLCKTSPLNARALVVMITGQDSPGIVVNALKNGFDDCLHKDDITFDLVSGLVDAALDKKSAILDATLFPTNSVTERANRPDDTPSAFSPLALDEVLERKVTQAIERALYRKKTQSYSPDFAAFLNAFRDDDDQFEF